MAFSIPNAVIAAPVITIFNPTTTPEQSKTITANTSEGTLTMRVTLGVICDGTLTFLPYASQTFTAESDNGKKVCYRADDGLGNTTYSMSAAIAGIDTTAPVITINNPTTAPEQSKTITASAPDGTLTMSNTLGMTCDGTLPFLPYASQTFTSESDNGYRVCYRAVDIAGNIGYSMSNAIAGIDTTAPVITINNPTTAPAQSKTITTSASDGTLTMSNTSGSVCDGTLTFIAYANQTFTLESDNGKKVCYRAVDIAGNVSYSMSDAIAGIDTTAPVITIDNPTTAPAQSKTITASTSDGTLTMSNTTGSVCDGTLTFGAYASQTFTLESDNGKKVCYRAMDTAKNVSYSMSNAIGGIDTTAPMIAISQPSPLHTKSGPVTFTITYTDANFSSSSLSVADISLVKSGTESTSIAVSGTGNTRTVTISNITGEGTIGIIVAAGTAQDLAGNAAPGGSSSLAIVDKTRPVVTLSSLPSGKFVTGGFTVTIDFVEPGSGSPVSPISGFGLSDISVEHGTITSFNSVSREVTVSPAGAYGSLIVLRVRENAGFDSAGNGSVGNALTKVYVATVPSVIDIAAGFGHTVALKSDSTVFAWGLDDSGQSTVPGDLTSVEKIAAGVDHTVALKSDGTVEGWGAFPTGIESWSGISDIAAGDSLTLALGDGTVLAESEVTSDGQVAVPEMEGIKKISAGAYHGLAVNDAGTVVAWGRSLEGQANVPSGLSGVLDVAGGGYHSMALKNDGTVAAWGDTTYGQTSTPSGLSGVVSISAGYGHSLALKSDGTVRAWGLDDYGQSSVPEGLSGVIAIAAGGYHSVALKYDGTIVAWGFNGYNQTTGDAVTLLPSGTTGGQNVTFTSDVGGINCTYNGTVTSGTCVSGNFIEPTGIVLTVTLPSHALIQWGSGCNQTTATTCTITSVTTPLTIAPILTYDNTAPVISIGAPSEAATKHGPVTYTVTYTDTNFGSSSLVPGNVSLNATGSATGTIGVSGTGNTRTVTISGITGDGTLGISIVAGTAVDLAGNTAPAAGPSTTFIVDNTAPTVTIGPPSLTSTQTGPVTYTVTYANAAAITLGTGDITLVKTGTADGSVEVTGAGTTTRTVTISGITGSGTLGISIAAGTASDSVGNTAPGASSATFAVQCYDPVWLESTAYFSDSLQAVYGIATSGDTIRMRGVPLRSENITLAEKMITINGGYACDYVSDSGTNTALTGSISSSSGEATLSKMDVTGAITVSGGIFRLKNSMVSGDVTLAGGVFDLQNSAFSGATFEVSGTGLTMKDIGLHTRVTMVWGGIELNNVEIDALMTPDLIVTDLLNLDAVDALYSGAVAIDGYLTITTGGLQIGAIPTP